MAWGARQTNTSTRGASALIRNVTSSTLYSAIVRAVGSAGRWAPRGEATAQIRNKQCQQRIGRLGEGSNAVARNREYGGAKLVR
jgi:hypothetical protein